jgi:predicted Zn finger-like uncharacterized protein
MLTRCPACHTRFRLHPAQLQAAGGRVRCGRCGHGFDARSPTLPAIASEMPPRVLEPTPSVAGQRPPRVMRGFFWLLGVMTLTATLILQAAWWERERLAAEPLGQRVLQHLCRHLPCDVQPPREPGKLVVLERNLTPHPQQPNALLFRVRLENRAAFAQPYPIVELRLLDSRQALAAARRFGPELYRGDSAGYWDLLPPHQPTEISLTLRDPGSHVTGFLLDFL